MSTSYRLASRKYKAQDSCIDVKGVKIGNGGVVVMAGPCAVSNGNTLMETAGHIKALGGSILRGGAYKIRTSPYSFQGTGEAGLKLLSNAGKKFGLPVVTEVTDPSDIDLISQYADILQIGSRNMQNTPLLKAAGSSRLPVLLKRGFSNTIDEWLCAAEYIMSEGNKNVILCERGIRTFEKSTRFSLDILSVPVVKKLSHLPLIVDPSHAAGDRELVPSVSMAAIAAGADGLIIEVSSSPEKEPVDSNQALPIPEFANLMKNINKIASVLGRN